MNRRSPIRSTGQLGLVAGVCLLVAGVLTPEQPARAESGKIDMTFVSYAFENAAPLASFRLLFTPQAVPATSSDDLLATSYIKFNFSNGVIGTYGLQIGASYEAIYFQIHDTAPNSGTTAPYQSGQCKRGSEGTSTLTTCRVLFDFQPGREYELLLTSGLDSSGGDGIWGLDIRDTTTSATTVIGDIRVTTSLDGVAYGLIDPASFRGGTALSGSSLTCAALPEIKLRWRGPYTLRASDWVGATSAVADYGSGCNNRTLSGSGAPTLTHLMGAGTVQTVVAGTNVWQVAPTPTPTPTQAPPSQRFVRLPSLQRFSDLFAELEPNNQPGLATPLRMSGGVYTGRTGDTNDYWRVEVTRAGTLTGTLTGLSAADRPQFFLYRQVVDANFLRYVASPPYTFSADVTPGVYYLRLYVAPDYVTNAPYQLSVLFPQ